MMVVVGRGTNEGGGWRVVKDQNRSALGGHSPVITTIGYGECTHRSLLNPCQDVHGGPSRRRGPRWVAGNGSREGCVSGTTTWLPRSADGSLTFLLGRFAQSVDAPAESHLHGRQLKACMDMGGAGWGALSEAAPSPPVFRTVDEPGCANEIWSRFCALLHHCFAAAQANKSAPSILACLRLCATQELPFWPCAAPSHSKRRKGSYIHPGESPATSSREVRIARKCGSH
jgi:hypothetical protein